MKWRNNKITMYGCYHRASPEDAAAAEEAAPEPSNVTGRAPKSHATGMPHPAGALPTRSVGTAGQPAGTAGTAAVAAAAVPALKRLKLPGLMRAAGAAAAAATSGVAGSEGGGEEAGGTASGQHGAAVGGLAKTTSDAATLAAAVMPSPGRWAVEAGLRSDVGCQHGSSLRRGRTAAIELGGSSLLPALSFGGGCLAARVVCSLLPLRPDRRYVHVSCLRLCNSDSSCPTLPQARTLTRRPGRYSAPCAGPLPVRPRRSALPALPGTRPGPKHCHAPKEDTSNRLAPEGGRPPTAVRHGIHAAAVWCAASAGGAGRCYAALWRRRRRQRGRHPQGPSPCVCPLSPVTDGSGGPSGGGGRVTRARQRWRRRPCRRAGSIRTR